MELNSKARTTESKKFWTPLPSPKSWGVCSPHCRPHFALHCTYWSSKLQLTRAKSTSTRLLNLPHLLLRKPKKIPHLAFSCYRHLNSRKPHTTPHLCERTTFTKIINKNNEIAINAKEQTVVHHSNRPVALSSMNIWVCSKRDFLWNIVFCGCATSLFLNSLAAAFLLNKWACDSEMTSIHSVLLWSSSLYMSPA